MTVYYKERGKVISVKVIRAVMPDGNPCEVVFFRDGYVSFRAECGYCKIPLSALVRIEGGNVND